MLFVILGLVLIAAPFVLALALLIWLGIRTSKLERKIRSRFHKE